MEDVGLESWEFFVSQYRVKFRVDIVMEFHSPFAGSAPSCSSSPLARKLTMAAVPVMARHGRSAQCQVIWPKTLYTCKLSL